MLSYSFPSVKGDVLTTGLCLLFALWAGLMPMIFYKASSVVWRENPALELATPWLDKLPQFVCWKEKKESARKQNLQKHKKSATISSASCLTAVAVKTNRNPWECTWLYQQPKLKLFRAVSSFCSSKFYSPHMSFGLGQRKGCWSSPRFRLWQQTGPVRELPPAPSQQARLTQAPEA